MSVGGAGVWDVVVVGAGPAGAAAALAARRARPDAAVLLLDRASFPRDKSCGDAVAPHAFDVLRELGVPDAAAGHPPVHHLRMVSPGGREAAAPARRATHVVPRTVFDARLVEAAVAAGAVLERRAVRRFEQRADRVVLDGEVAARVVVGADGANSAVRRLAGAPPHDRSHVALAVRGYARLPEPAGPRAPTPPEMVIRMVPDGWPAYAWLFPLGDGTANVGYGTLVDRLGRSGRAGRTELWERLAELVPEAPADPATLRAHHLPLSPGRVGRLPGRVLLAGDAAGLVNPLTGEGIYYAVESGRLAGEAAVHTGASSSGDPGSAYDAALRRRLGRHLRHTDVLGRVTRHLPLLEAGIAAAAASTAAYDELHELGLGRGTLSVAGLGRVLRRYPAAARAVRRRTGPS